MLKWFRKYDKHLLAALIVVLMLTFLIQDTLYSRSHSREVEPWGTIHGRQLTTADLAESQSVVALLSQLNPMLWQEPWLILLYPQQPQLARFMTQLPPLTLEEFAILRTEAAASGAVISDDRIHQFEQMVSQERVNYVRRNQNVTIEQIRSALADVLRIDEMAREVMDGILISDAEVRHRIRDLQDKVEISLVSFPAKKFVEESASIPDAELLEQFEKHKNDEPAPGKSGYRRPRRVAIEALVIRPDAMQESVNVTDEQVRQFYRKNRERYVKADDAPAASQAAASSPASAASSAPAYKPLREVQAEIIKEIKSSVAQKRTREHAEQVVSELSRVWTDQPRDKDGFLVRPAGVDAPDFLKQAADRFAKQYGLTVEAKPFGLISVAELNDHEILGKLQPLSNQPQQYAPSEFLFRVPGFFQSEKRAAGAGESRPQLAFFEPTPIAYAQTNDKGETVSFCILRVTEAREPEAPKSLDEVRDLVVKDVRTNKADAIADEHAERLYAAAQSAGLKAALDADPGLRAMLSKVEKSEKEGDKPAEPADPLLTPAPFARRIQSFMGDMAAFVDGIGTSESAVAAAFEMTDPNWTSPASSRPAATQVSAPATQPAPKVRIVRLPESQSRVVMELKKYDSVREDAFTTTRERTRFQIAFQRRVECAKAWFNRDAIYARTQFKLSKPAEIEPTDGAGETQ